MYFFSVGLNVTFLSQALTSVVNFREPKSICKAPELVSVHARIQTRMFTHTLSVTHSALTGSCLPWCVRAAGEIL